MNSGATGWMLFRTLDYVLSASSALRPCCPHPDQDKVLQRIEIRNKKKLSEFNRGIYIFMDIVRSYGGWGWGLGVGGGGGWRPMQLPLLQYALH